MIADVIDLKVNPGDVKHYVELRNRYSDPLLTRPISLEKRNVT
jgi:hypothetical protein